MSDQSLENKIKKHADAIFGGDVALPSGHRERFKQRLKELNDMTQAAFPEDTELTENVRSAGQPETRQKPGKVLSFKKRLIISVAVAAVMAGFVFLLNLFVEKYQPDQKLADVRNYYKMQLEIQVDETRRLIQHVDETYREALLANIEQIENEPLPDVLITDDEYIVLIAGIYTRKIETLQNVQNIIKENI
jgi:hypothetical protein